MKKNQNKPQNRSITAATGKISADQLDQELQIRGSTDSKWNIFRHPRAPPESEKPGGIHHFLILEGRGDLAWQIATSHPRKF